MTWLFSFRTVLLVSVLLHGGLGWWYYAHSEETTPPRRIVQMGVNMVSSRAAIAQQADPSPLDAPDIIERTDAKPVEPVELVELETITPKKAEEIISRLDTSPDRAPILRQQDIAQLKLIEMLPAAEPIPPPPPVKNTVIATQAAPNSTAQQGATVDELPIAITTNPSPKYPDQELQNGIEGKVVLRVKIDVEGKVEKASVHQSSGIAAFDESALKTVRDWVFIPARRGGKAVPYEFAKPFTFAISNK